MSINLHEGQTEVYEDMFVDMMARFAVVCCSRGWGKSYLAGATAITGVFELMQLSEKIPNKVVYIIAPTYEQVTDIYYPMLSYEMGLEEYCLKSSKDQGRFWFPNRVELRLLSYESIERMRGKGAYLVVWDEVSSCLKGITPKEAWEGVIQPAILTRWSRKRAAYYGAPSPGRALIISTPKGYNYLHHMFNNQENNTDWKSYHYDYTQSPFLDVEEIDKIKHDIDPIEFASEYLASFAESGNSVFYCFDRKRHVTNSIPDFHTTETHDKNEDVHCCIDFNVGIQATSVLAIRGNQVHVLHEFKGHPDTEALGKAISERWKGHRIFAYPDPSGRSRKTSAAVGKTDFTILESYGITCLAHAAAPSIIDSVAAVNRKLMTAAGDVDFYIHPRCTGTITSLERTKWVDKNPNLATIDKSEGIEHYSDGLRYFMEYKYPILSTKKKVARGFGF